MALTVGLIRPTCAATAVCQYVLFRPPINKRAPLALLFVTRPFIPVPG
jgi:hypothetical protein